MNVLMILLNGEYSESKKKETFNSKNEFFLQLSQLNHILKSRILSPTPETRTRDSIVFASMVWPYRSKP